MAKAYVVSDIDVTDPEQYESYKAMAPAAIAAYGGRYLVRGGPAEVPEGDRTPHRTVVLEFDDIDSARRWHASAEYSEAKAVRRRSATSSLILVQGV